MLKASGLKLTMFLGLSALGHGLLLYPWPSTTQSLQLVAQHDGSLSMTIVVRPTPAQTTNAQAEKQQPRVHKKAPHKVDTKPASVPALPDRSRILTEIHTAFKDHFYYPSQALRLGIEGQVLLGFELDGEGNIHNIKVLRSSGSNILDHAAMDALAQMGNLPQLRGQLYGHTLTIQLPVRYQRT